MTDLVDFLLARIAEDKATALTARMANGVWEFTGITWPGPSRVTEWVHDVVPPRNGSRSWDIHNYIARWDPARGLAECEAKRLIVTLHPLADGYCEGCGIGTQIPDGCLNLRALALPYADHPDFRPEWKPT